MLKLPDGNADALADTVAVPEAAAEALVDGDDCA
jgi:hypothetical protein